MSIRRLNQDCLHEQERMALAEMKQTPPMILQIGEGNFLRGFFDWMIHECRKQGLFDGNIVVTQPRPSGSKNIRELRTQDGLYTLVVRGVENGDVVERRDVVSVFSQAIDPFAEWESFLHLAENPHLKIVVSNTTEAGLVYEPVALQGGQAPVPFPARLTAFLHHRFVHFGSDAPAAGLTFFPCELLERNGDELKRCILRHSDDWEFGEDFKNWIENHNVFLNSLVDRIVTGFPSNEASEWFSEWGYEDSLLTVAEPYHIWAIEADVNMEQLLPFQKAGLNVHWVSDLKPYQIRKVRILNGAHSLMTPPAILEGLAHVRDVMDNKELVTFVRDAVEEEIIPSLPLDREEMREYAKAVFERFQNPFNAHRLLDISLNSISKYRIRLLPSLEGHLERTGELPSRIVRGFASLIRLYKVKKEEENFVGTRFDGTKFQLKDDVNILGRFEEVWSSYDGGKSSLQDVAYQILSNESMWGKNLTNISELVESVSTHLRDMEALEC